MKHIKRFDELVNESNSQSWREMNHKSNNDRYILVSAYAWVRNGYGSGDHKQANISPIAGETIRDVAKECLEMKFFVKNPNLDKIVYLVDELDDIWFVYNDYSESGKIFYMKICEISNPSESMIHKEGIRRKD